MDKAEILEALVDEMRERIGFHSNIIVGNNQVLATLKEGDPHVLMLKTSNEMRRKEIQWIKSLLREKVRVEELEDGCR